MRISWEEYALNVAETASSRSEDHYVQVGACALNEQHMVVAVGYNGLATGKDVRYDFWRNRDHRRKYMIHAEVNCLSLFKKGRSANACSHATSVLFLRCDDSWIRNL